MAICLFCNNVADSKEDVWPLWILDIIKTKESIWRTIGKTPAFVTPNQDIKIKCVCKTCNNGWMSNLENECKPLLKSLIEDTPRTLNQSEKELIAVWVTKTGIILDSIKKESARFYTRLECQAVREHRTIPLGTLIWIGRFEEIGLSYTGSDLSGIESNVGLPYGEPNNFVGTVNTLLLDHLIFQVLVLRSTADKDGAVTIEPHFQRCEELLSVIWPSGTAPLLWPLNVSFSNAGNVSFAHLLRRWSGSPKTINDTSY